MILFLLACHPAPILIGLQADSGGDSACPGVGDLYDDLYRCVGATTTSALGSTPLYGVAVPHGPVAISVGDLPGEGTPQVYIGTNSTLTRLSPPDWDDPVDIWSQADDGSAVYPAIGDIDGDGAFDLLLGLPGSDSGDGQIAVFHGPILDSVSWDDPHDELAGDPGAGRGFGRGMHIGDLTGDGLPDLLVNTDGDAILVEGPLPAGRGPAPVFARWLGAATLGDLDADGVDDILVDEPFLSPDPAADCPQRPGGAVLYRGPLGPGTHDGADGDLVVWGSSAFAHASPAGVGDLTGDGVDDLLMYEESVDGDAPAQPVLAVLPGPLTANEGPALLLSASISPLFPMLDFDDGTRGLLATTSSVWWYLVPEASRPSFAAVMLPGPPPEHAPFDIRSCALSAPTAWTMDLPGAVAEASWLGDLDGDGRADAVLASTGADGGGLAFVLRDLGGLPVRP